MVRRPKGSKIKPALRFKQSEVERAVRSVQTQGLNVTRVEIDLTNGKIAVFADDKEKRDAA